MLGYTGGHYLELWNHGRNLGLPPENFAYQRCTALLCIHVHFKGGYAHFTMCILHFQLIDLDLWNVFCEVTSCLLSRGQTKYATLGMRLWCKYIRNYLLVYQLTSHLLPYLRNYKEFEGEISDLQLEKYGLSFETKKSTTSVWARGDDRGGWECDRHKGL